MNIETIQNLLGNIPNEWYGTTYNNSKLITRQEFISNLIDLKSNKITRQELENIGNSSDYFRVGSNISTIFEYIYATNNKLDYRNTYSFSSIIMPILAIYFTTNKKMNLWIDEIIISKSLIDISILDSIFTQLEIPIHIYSILHINDIANSINVYMTISNNRKTTKKMEAFVDIITIGNNLQSILYIEDTNTLSIDNIYTFRKRLSTPSTNSFILDWFNQKRTNNDFTIENNNSIETVELYNHLDIMVGNIPNKIDKPILCSSGLSTLASLWFSFICDGGIDICICSTAYGGSSQLCDLFEDRFPELCKKHMFDIQGEQNIMESIENCVNNPNKKFKTMVLFIEMPTNPDMKVIDLEKLTTIVKNIEKTQKIIVLIDTTFSPCAKIMSLLPNLDIIVFMSLSKNVSRGCTTAGALIGNERTNNILYQKNYNVKLITETLDTKIRLDQLNILNRNHINVEKRCIQAYNIAKEVMEYLENTIYQITNKRIKISFITKENNEKYGITTGTFSFNLPAPIHYNINERKYLAQQFVDIITLNPLFTPCVSFGQDNNLVYITVPATSTQGAILDCNKEKQEKDGVQLVRLSFPPKIDINMVKQNIKDTLLQIYN